MKSKQLFRIIVGTSLPLFAIAPVFSLTSCAKISQYTMPIMTGGTTANDGIFGDIPLAQTVYDPTIEVPVSFSSYLPTQFDTYIDSSSGGQPNAYVYTKPDDVNSSAWDPTTAAGRVTSDAGWYNYADSKLAPNINGKNSISSYKNLNIANLASSTSSIVYNLSTMINTMLSFIKQPAILTIPNNFNSWMPTMFPAYEASGTNGFFGSNPTPTDKINFYSMFFSLLNNLDEGKQGIKFDISNSNFKYESSVYGPGQLIEKDKITANASPNPGVVDTKFYMGSITKPTDDTQAPDAGTLSKQYIAYALDSDRTNYVPNSMPYGLPTLFNLNDTKYAYYNPLDKHSYDQRDWLINDINVVKNRVNSSGEWNKMGDLTGDHTKTDWVPSLTYTVKHANGATTGFDSSIKNMSTNWNSIHNDGALEQSWQDLLGGITNDKLKPDSFIAISHYGVASYKTVEGDVSSLSIRNPIFSYISSVFPTYLLYTRDNTGALTIDPDLFTKQFPARELADKKLQKDADKLYYFDEDKANEKMSKIMNYFRSNISPTQAIPTNPFDLYCLNFFQRMFGSYISNNPTKILAADWIQNP